MILVAGFPAAGQTGDNSIKKQVRLSLVDTVTGKPVAFAHVLIENIGTKSGVYKGLTSGEKGMVNFSTAVPVKITATFVGYQNLVDTIYPGEHKKLFMSPTVYNVDEVVITAQYQPETVDKSIYKIKVLGSQTINQKAAVNLNEMLAGELNIRSTHDNVLGSSISMQGLSGEHVKFLVDGVPVIGRQNGNIDLQQLNLQNIDHIEIIQGPMSVVYGSNALAGVINIITKESDKQKMSLNAEAYYESVGAYNFTGGGSYAKNRNSFLLNAGRNFFDGFSTNDSATRFMQWKPKLQWDFEGSYMYKSPKTKLRLSGNYFYEKIQDKGNPLEVFNYDKAFDKYFYTNRFVIRSEWTQLFNKRANLNLMSAYSYYSRIKNTFLKDLTNLGESLVPESAKQDTSRFDNILLRGDYNNSLKNGKLQYKLGIDLNRETGYGKRIKDYSQEIGDYAAFISLNYIPVPVLNIQPGLRVIYNTKYKAPLVYSLNIKWNITEPLSLRLSTAKGFRAPSLKELYLDFVDVNHNIHGNENLQAETSTNINLALGYNPHRPSAYNWGFDLGLFYNHIRNKIELMMITADPLLYSYINIDQFYTQGFELNFNNSIYPWLRLKAGYSLTGRKQVDIEVSGNQDFIYSTDVTLQANYNWHKTDLNFSLFYKYNGAYPQLVLNDKEQTEVSTTAPYNSLDISTNRWFLKRMINVQMGVKNLFNNTDVLINGGSGGGGIHSGGGGSVPVNWGRTFFVRVRFLFNR
ncbi:MAG TPA: TonB-dependent receptor [Bacteroidetes bacterium]|nr:TonB-dependent receptor [Bacteroidota bacterium]